MRVLAKAYIGTSGFTYAHWGGGVFYPSHVPQAKWLEYYCQYFNTVEINASFYHLPKRSVFEGWYRRTPEKFIFAIKGSRFITHIKKLRKCEEPVERFFEAASGLGKKLAVVLWQLPPGLRADAKKLKEFCQLLQSNSKAGRTRHAFEFRHESWFNEEVYKVLKAYDCALSIAHSSRYPLVEVVTASFVYLRFHGGGALYASNYSDKELKEWAKKCITWLKTGEDVYAYFNNDAYGFAVRNAQTLDEFIRT